MIAFSYAILQEFLSTPSARRATADLPPDHDHRTISIHALREEGDASGDRPQKLSMIFLSTPSARRATQHLHIHPPRSRISIHALREEGDLLAGVLLPLAGEFLSTPSARRATFS